MNTEIFEMARNVYANLNDEISKKLFEAKCLYAMTGDIGALTGLDSKYRNLNSDMQVYASKIKRGSHILLYGAGVAGHYLAGRFKHFGVNIDAFIDEDETKGQVDEATGIRIIKEKDLLENKALYAEKTIVISYPVKPVAYGIKKRLLEDVGVSEENIAMGIYDWRNNQGQYFDFFEPNENEVFVDCGCYDGGTCFRFAGWCSHKGYEKIYSFEADPKNFVRCQKLLENLGKCELRPFGIAQKHEKVYFASRAFEDSCIISKEEAEKMNFEGVETIETISLDEALEGERITFLKMDIEGSEYGALLGAEKLIKENHPRMAISIYHDLEDFITIPALILKMNPDYRITMRQYGLDELETILYVE